LLCKIDVPCSVDIKGDTSDALTGYQKIMWTVQSKAELFHVAWHHRVGSYDSHDDIIQLAAGGCMMAPKEKTVFQDQAERAHMSPIGAHPDFPGVDHWTFM
jgi:hypothetical protein